MVWSAAPCGRWLRASWMTDDGDVYVRKINGELADGVGCSRPGGDGGPPGRSVPRGRGLRGRVRIGICPVTPRELSATSCNDICVRASLLRSLRTRLRRDHHASRPDSTSRGRSCALCRWRCGSRSGLGVGQHADPSAAGGCSQLQPGLPRGLGLLR
jgi:hypothetical protein